MGRCLHLPNVGEELNEMLDDSWVPENIASKDHDAWDNAELVFVGTTSTHGTVVKQNRVL